MHLVLDHVCIDDRDIDRFGALALQAGEFTGDAADALVFVQLGQKLAFTLLGFGRQLVDGVEKLGAAGVTPFSCIHRLIGSSV